MKIKSFLVVLISMLSFTVMAADTLVTKSGLKYVVIRKGTGKKPVKGSSVKVSFIGKLQNGRVFENTYDLGTTFKFTIENNEVIKGWDEGFQLMSEGEKAVLIIPPHLAYGKKGLKDPDDETQYLIPPDSTLIYEVELLKVK